MCGEIHTANDAFGTEPAPTHAAALRHDRSPLDTEDLRQAFIHYRALFAALLERSDADERGETPADGERTEEVRR